MSHSSCISIVSNIQSLKVLPPEFTSVHCPVSIELKCSFNIDQQRVSAPVHLPPKLIWDPAKVDVLRKNLLSSQNAEMLRNLSSNLAQADSANFRLDTSVSGFSSFLVGEAKNIMNTQKVNARKRKPKVI